MNKKLNNKNYKINKYQRFKNSFLLVLLHMEDQDHKRLKHQLKSQVENLVEKNIVVEVHLYIEVFKNHKLNNFILH